MDPDSQQRSSLPVTGIVAVLLLGLGIIVQHLPLESLRPSAGVPTGQRPVAQDVNARLWQDPFEAVRQRREEILKSGGATSLETENKTHDCKIDLRKIRPEPAPPTETNATSARKARDRPKPTSATQAPVEIMAVMVFGAPYSEAAEMRRRTRYAVLAALMNRGLHADDAEHLGYLRCDPNGKAETDLLPEFVPYEVFKDDAGEPRLLLWLNEDAFRKHPVERLLSLLAKVEGANGSRPTMKIIGPSLSGTLSAIMDRFCDGGADTARARAAADARSRLQFYVATATAPDGALLPGKCPFKSLAAAATGGHVKLLRAIASDDNLVAKLKDELNLRGVRLDAEKGGGAEHIALISELETLYGRELAKALKPEGTVEFHQYAYFRGLDGETAGPRSDASSKPSGTSDSGSADRNESRKATEEFAAGNRQLDYLRRLAEKIKADDAELRASGKGTFKAIGVLGFDFYDKQLVLQALRKELPDALFFTTDLDARMLDPRLWPSMRNLIVVSSFGLSLRTALQGSTPPFRDSYQTASYLATLLALSDAAKDPESWIPRLDPWLKDIRVFEIGRTGAFDLSAASDSTGDNECGLANFGECKTIHPPGSPFLPISGALMWAIAFCMFFFAVLLLLETAWWFRSMVLATWQSLTIRSRLAAGVIGLGLPAAFAVWACREGRADGEPFAWMEGISSWPSYLLRYVAVLLCFYFLMKAWRDGTTALEQTTTRFFPGETRRVLDLGALGPPWLPAWYHNISLYHWAPGPVAAGAGPRADAWQIVERYHALGSFRHRAVRVAFAAVLYICFAGALICFFGVPATPYRGSASWWAHWFTLVPAVILFVFLLLWVVDATRLFQRLVEHLIRTDTRYPGKTVDYFSGRLNLPAPVVDRYLSDWLDIQLIADRSRFVSQLVYYPFIIIAILLLARSPLIDNWTTPVGLGLVVLLGLSYAFFCALSLRGEVEEARSLAIANMTRHILHAKGDSTLGAAVVGQLEKLLEEIRTIREGAFMPFSQQPVFKAALVPLGSYGMLEIAQYLLFALR